jgi:hypothetical protein
MPGEGVGHGTQDQSSVSCGLRRRQADYAYWKVRAAANLANRRDVKPGIIPEPLWRRLYIGALTAEGCGSGRHVPPTTTTTRSPAIGLSDDDRRAV